MPAAGYYESTETDPGIFPASPGIGRLWVVKMACA